jgi:hypothetical protein
LLNSFNVTQPKWQLIKPGLSIDNIPAGFDHKMAVALLAYLTGYTIHLTGYVAN